MFVQTPYKRPYYKSTKLSILAALSAIVLTTAGCQSLQSTNQTIASTPTLQAQKLDDFNITGKIGVSAPTNRSANTANNNVEGGSAFYAWSQQNERFAIELIGALGVGKTNIEYDGQTATLVSEKTGTLTANDPETLLQKATGWQAPISQIPYWISGRPAPSDSAPQMDAQGRLISSVNGQWTASFTYKGAEKLPSKISATQPTGQKVIMTINHQD